MAKSPTAWTPNSLSVSTDTYEPAGVTYDTIYTHYDGNQDVTASPVSAKTPTVWAAA